MRMLVYNQLNGHTSTEKIRDVILTNSLLLGIDLPPCEVPSRKSSERMQLELGVVSDLKAGHFLYSTDGLTLGFDSTTQKGVHVNTINVHKGKSQFILAMDELPGGLSDDYGNHIITTIKYLADIYSSYHGLSKGHVEETMISHVHNTMTDRAAVNQATIRKLNKTWNSNINNLFCHLHPLDTIASSVKTCLKDLEDSQERQLSKSGCIAEQILAAFDRLRFADNLGDPKGFSLYLAECGLKKGIIKSNRGNRLHLSFNQSEVHADNRDIFLKYISSKCHKNIDYLQRLKHDYTTTMAQEQFQALAIFSKILSAPWMRRFYRSAETTYTHMEAFEQVKTVMANLTALGNKDPICVDDIKEDLFGDKLVKDSALWNVSASSRVPHMLMKMAETVNVVLKRQYSSYLNMTDAEIEKIRKDSEGASVNNILCEELVGMFSMMQERAPNASLIYIAAKVKCSKNKVIPYLMQMDKETRETLIKKTVHVAATVKRESQQYVQNMHKEISKRVHQKIYTRKVADRRKLGKKIKECMKSDSKLSLLQCNEAVKSGMLGIIKGSVTGKYMMHIWYDRDLDEDVAWYGKVLRFNKTTKGDPMLIVNYWTEDGCESNGKATPMSVYDLAADYYSKELWFL